MGPVHPRVAAAGFGIQLVPGTKFSLNKHQLFGLMAARDLGVRLLRLPVVARGKDHRHGSVRDPGRAQRRNSRGPAEAVIRTLALPLSFLILGLGFIGILLNRDRHALHDRLAGTVVVYSWDARATACAGWPGRDPATPT